MRKKKVFERLDVILLESKVKNVICGFAPHSHALRFPLVDVCALRTLNTKNNV